jgi:hypothetical protein
MLDCQGKAPEASRIIAAIEDPRVEMGRDWNGLHSRITLYVLMFHM